MGGCARRVLAVTQINRVPTGNRGQTSAPVDVFEVTDGFILLDREWCFVYANPEAARILRRDRDELKGRCLLTEFPETAAGKFLEKCQDAMERGISVEFEKYYPPLGIWVYMKVSPSDLGLTMCIRDDTERINSRREILNLKAQLAARQAAA